MKRTFLAAAIVLAPALVQAWDGAGHMLVGQIAWEACSPKTREAVSALVAGLDNRFNDAQPYHFVTAGCWMDDMRSMPRKDYLWSKWHYMDSQKSADGSLFKVPEPPHLVWAVGENLKTIRDPNAPQEDRAKAVGQLMHWIGDIHQPLHTTTWDDRGGNGYLITGVTFTDLMPGMVSNLHTYWDKAFRFAVVDGKIAEQWYGPLVRDRPARPGGGVIGAEAQKLMARFPKEKLDELKKPADAEAWARENHLLGCTKAYPPGEHTTDTEVRKLEPEFVASCYEISGRRVVIAGHRLAALLDDLFGAK